MLVIIVFSKTRLTARATEYSRLRTIMRFSLFSGKKRDELSGSTQDPFFLGRSDHFEWRSQGGNNSVNGSAWIMREGVSYLEKIYSVYRSDILQLGDANRVPIRVTVKPSSECQGGIAGATGNGELRLLCWAVGQ